MGRNKDSSSLTICVNQRHLRITLPPENSQRVQRSNSPLLCLSLQSRGPGFLRPTLWPAGIPALPGFDPDGIGSGYLETFSLEV